MYVWKMSAKVVKMWKTSALQKRLINVLEKIVSHHKQITDIFLISTVYDIWQTTSQRCVLDERTIKKVVQTSNSGLPDVFVLSGELKLMTYHLSCRNSWVTSFNFNPHEDCWFSIISCIEPIVLCFKKRQWWGEHYKLQLSLKQLFANVSNNKVTISH